MNDSLRDLSRYVFEKLVQPSTYVVALVVGTLINLYGQVLVPYLRDEPEPVLHFVRECAQHPLLASISVLIAYLFPILVGVYSSVATRYATRGLESRAQFPDAKPDPVFRVNRDGAIVEMGAHTASVFARHGIARAQEFFGEELWEALLTRGTHFDTGESMYVAPLGAWFVVSCSDGPRGTLNIYASASRPPTGAIAPDLPGRHSAPGSVAEARSSSAPCQLAHAGDAAGSPL